MNKEFLERYKRNIMLEQLGIEGQQKLCNSKVLVIGSGGLGSPVLMYLSASGVGEIGVVDFDVVDLSNLQRQIIHTTADINIQKVKSAKAKMEAINPNIKVTTYNLKVLEENIYDLIKNYDFVVECTDNFDAKFLINRACVKSNIAYSFGGIFKFSGQSMTIIPNKSACYSCIFNVPPPKDLEISNPAGILGSVAGVIGTIQATETIKYLLGIGENLINTLLTFDALNMEFRKVKFKPNIECQVCGSNKDEI